MAIWLTELRVAWRALLRRPGFLLLATLTLALGIGATITVTSLVDRVLLRPLPYPQPAQLFATGLTQTGGWNTITPEEYRTVESVPGIASAGIASMGPVPVNIAEVDRPELVQAVTADIGFLRTLAPAMTLGRNFVAAEDVPHGEPAVILSHALWQRRFEGDPQVLGRTLAIEGRPTPIVGVLPADFRYVTPFDVLTPLALPSATRDNGRNYLAIARLAGDAAPGPVSDLVHARINELYVGTRAAELYARSRFGVSSLSAAFSAQSRPVLLLFLASAGCVLLLAAVNLGNLMLLRALGRSHVATVRGALGASRWRLALPMLAEGLLIGLCATVLGVLFALIALRLAGERIPAAWFGGEVDLSLGATAWLTAFAAGLLAALLAAALGVWRGRARDGARELVAGGRSGLARGAGRLTRVGVVAQVALATVLLAGAGLFSRALHDAAQVDLGYRADGVIGFEIAPVRALYPDADSVRRLNQTLVERLDAIPGARAATAGTNLPIGQPLNYPVAAPGQEMDSVEFRAVTPGFFDIFAIPVLAGRAFDQREAHGGEPVLLVNQAYVDAYLAPNAGPASARQALDATLTLPVGEQQIGFRVLGVVGNTRQHGPEQASPPMVYLPFAQFPDGLLTMLRDYMPLRFALRVQGDPATYLAAITAAVAEIAPGQPIANLKPLPELVQASTGGTRLNLQLVGAFAIGSLLLAAVGLYAVIAVTAGARQREFGVRSALGASRRGLIALVIGDGVRQVALGLLLGVLLSLALARLLQAYLSGISAYDPLVLAGVAIVLLVVALAACLWPALRAARVSPMQALRGD